ncbi:MAG: ELM1/GtrOC1 family putative glycosyltransferase [Candidatus Omnitrophota bacterium]
MKPNSIVDYSACILFRLVSFFTAYLPLNFSLFFGRRLGDLIYLFDRKHRLIAYTNIRHALADKINWQRCKKITRSAYQSFGQNLMEISFIGRIDKQYLEKYIQIENKDNIDAAFKRGKGVIFLAVHEGDWELSNIICANLGFPFTLFVRDQGLPRLNDLLNSYRLKRGAKIIHKKAGVRQLIEVLKNNQAIGMTTDQGGKNGQLVRFFGQDASMAVGAVKLALKYDCSIIPVFYTRIKGPYTKVFLDQVYTVTRSENPENDLKDNLQRIISVYENYIRKYPYEYLWTYKVWKYGKDKEILILSDGKTGHLRQSEGLAKLINQQLSSRGIKTNLFIKEVKFGREALVWLQIAKAIGRIDCLRHALTDESWQSLMSSKPDYIISAGGLMSVLNYLLARENQAKSICLMKPSNISLKKFNLVIVPEHDGNFKRKNVVITEGALNLIDADYLNQKLERIRRSGLIKAGLLNPCIGVLIGGDSKNFSLDQKIITKLAVQIKKSAEELNASLLISTSRRTSPEVQEQVKNEFANYPRCKLLVIANENNNPDVVGGIIGLSNIIINSPESISMISEAAAGEKYVVVFKARGLSRKHERFLKKFQTKKYIYFKQIEELADCLNWIWQNKPQVNSPRDDLKVIEGLNKII